MTEERELFNWIVLGITLSFLAYAAIEAYLVIWHCEYLANKYEHMLLTRQITFEEFTSKKRMWRKRENPYIDVYIAAVNIDDLFDCVTSDGKNHTNVTIVSTVCGFGILSAEGYLYLTNEIVLRKKHG